MSDHNNAVAKIVAAAEEVEAETLLDAAETLSPCGNYLAVDLTAAWVPETNYLTWAKKALGGGDAFGFDAAVCYAKRAACCRIDKFIVQNHLSYFLKAKYPEKMEAALGEPSDPSRQRAR